MGDVKIWNIRFLPLWAGLVFFNITQSTSSQQIQWAKVYALPEEDQVYCITKDDWGDMYMGGSTRKGAFFPGGFPRAMIYKLNPDGDTIYSLWTGIYGTVMSIAIDNYGFVRLAVFRESSLPNQTQLHLLTMSQDGFIFKRDTIPKIIFPNHSCIGKDSSWIICGYKQNDFNGFVSDIYVQRIRKDGTIEPFQILSNGFSGRAHRVEQLPNGKYLVSGVTGGKIISFTLNEDLSNPQPYETWYQAQGSSSMSTGLVSRINGNRYMIGGAGGPCVVGQFDSLKQKYWLQKNIGTQVPPQAMTDGSVVFGYRTGAPLFQTMYRIGVDSSTIWNMALKDSLLARGLNGSLTIVAFAYFEDQSAVLAGRYYLNGTTDYDPFFIKIANVGTPVTSLSKPKKGSLANETLAPWPNPTDGTLYLKQHFDKAEVHFYSISGKEVGQFNIRFGQPIDVSGFPAGLYLYRANIDGKAFSGKIIRN